jgi:hypothetical protein
MISTTIRQPHLHLAMSSKEAQLLTPDYIAVELGIVGDRVESREVERIIAVRLPCCSHRS